MSQNHAPGKESGEYEPIEVVSCSTCVDLIGENWEDIVRARDKCKERVNTCSWKRHRFPESENGDGYLFCPCLSREGTSSPVFSVGSCIHHLWLVGAWPNSDYVDACDWYSCIFLKFCSIYYLTSVCPYFER